ncbi:Phosphatidylinositol/phosphatidylcholine transfer protein SFH3 [Linum perenne]
MGDQTGNYSSSRNSLVATASNGNKIGKRNSIAALQNAGRKIARLSPSAKGGRDAVCHVGVFLLKLVALETVRRVSRSKCPPVWRGVQALQFLCYPPFKWIQRWAPFKGVVQGVQMMSRPLLVLSIATVFSDDLTCSNEPLDSNDGPHTNMETSPESPSNHSSPDARSSDVNAHSLAPEHWMLELHKELENQGITLPERINEDEIRRFYTTADGDFQSCLSSVKNTIRWRETYRLLSEHELGMWSNVVFWHGYDLENQPCLIVRLGLACTNLAAQDRPRFVQAVITQVEHGILHLLKKDSPQIMVVLDCGGITPLRIPMQMVRSCSSHLQQNFPNRLGRLVIIRLTPVARVIAQTFLQVLKPVTKEKLRVEGKKYHRVLSEYLQTVPAYLGGNCTCQRCSDTGNHNELLRPTNDTIKREHDISDGEGRQGPAASLLLTSQVDNCHPNDTEWDRVLKSAVIGILMACVFVVLVIGLYDSETRPFMAPPV